LRPIYCEGLSSGMPINSLTRQWMKRSSTVFVYCLQSEQRPRFSHICFSKRQLVYGEGSTTDACRMCAYFTPTFDYSRS
jgi:hypothetical protein